MNGLYFVKNYFIKEISNREDIVLRLIGDAIISIILSTDIQCIIKWNGNDLVFDGR